MDFKILFKTKGGHKEGMGDVTSSLALAREFKEQGNDVFFIINNNKNVIDLVEQNSFKSIVAEGLYELTDYLNGQHFDIAILNQLNTPEDEALILKRHSEVMVTIEDTGSSSQLADLCFNILYPIDNAITDFKFIPLASIFQEKHNNLKLIKKDVNNILVMQGGSDTYGFTPKILKALYSLQADININVVIGHNFSNYSELNHTLGKSPRKFNVIEGRNDMSDLMIEADLAISAGGNTLFELACLGVPAIVVCGEPFEVGTADRLQKEGFGVNLGFGKEINEEDVCRSVINLMGDYNQRLKMSIAGKELIDGGGRKKIVHTMIDAFYIKDNFKNEKRELL